MQHFKSYAHLRCPDDHTELTLANDSLIREVNQRIKAGCAVNRGGRRVLEPIAAGLVRTAGDLLYPIVHGIPLLLRDEAISIDFPNQ